MKLYENALSETKLTDQRRLSFTGARVFEALAEAGDAARRSTHEQVVRRKEGRKKGGKEKGRIEQGRKEGRMHGGKEERNKGGKEERRKEYPSPFCFKLALT